MEEGMFPEDYMTRNSTEYFLYDDPRNTDSLLTQWNKMYRKAHGYVSGVICIFGLFSNIVNTIVLTRKHVITPVNCILTAIAVVDGLKMSDNLIFAVYFYMSKELKWESNHSFAWIYYLLIHINFSIVCHTMAMLFTVYLAAYRYMFVCKNETGSRKYGVRQTTIAIVIIGTSTILLCSPYFFLYQVEKVSNMSDSSQAYWYSYSDFALAHSVYVVILFWSYSVMKVVPCIILMFLITRIVMAIHHSNETLKRLQKSSRLPNRSGIRQRNQTSYMLVIVVLIFVITEMPNGILIFISSFSEHFFVEVYSNLGDALDILALLNSSVNFILYCLMNQQFRETLRRLIKFNFVGN
ncbi:G-protein coupled receptor dmsr-1-like [Mercenaria mercenaria]|uniref:G-protein coupled receptor dmsr-1-like n=1 Tax=Mercenaria mercenaria TaxID=6596 RepID=UPI00234F038D|nr:G-protein coupled receptor dmsr-1-like [Mercenaria mercenaria]